MALIGDGRGGVFCENTLERMATWSEVMQQKIKPGGFDVVLTNPPFGKKIVVKGEPLLSQFDLGYKWKRNKETKSVEKTSTLHDDQPPQILFLERCLQLLKPGGRLGIVLPESIFGNPSYQFIIAWLTQRFQIAVIASMPEALFKTSGKGGTHTKVCILIGTKKQPDKQFDIFMGEARWCGHDSHGNQTYRKDAFGNMRLLDEIPAVAERYVAWRSGSDKFIADHQGFILPSNNIIHGIFIPRYYNPEIKAEIERLSHEYKFITIGELVKQHAISIETGIEIGKMAYGTGSIPFIRTSDISNWEIKADFKHGVSNEIYESFRNKIDVQAGDILVVKDGTYLVGSSAIVTDSDLPMLFQSHLYRIRVLKQDEIDPWLLFVLLNTPLVRLQVKAKQFTQDIIDTLGMRIHEIALPIPRDNTRSTQVSDDCKRIIEMRIKLRGDASKLVASIGSIEQNSA